MHRISVVSSVIRSIGYDEQAMILEIEFSSGETYQYRNVPRRTYLELLAADSKGRYFASSVKSAFSHERL